jgi:hypothetical protein
MRRKKNNEEWWVFNTGNLSVVLKKKHSIAPQGPPIFFWQKTYPGKFVLNLLTINK